MFLETLPNLESLLSASGAPEGALAALGAVIAAFIAIFFVAALAVYVYMSIAYMGVAKKAKLSAPGLAWIPGIGPTITAYRASKMHWWPWLFLIGLFIPAVGFLLLLAFVVFGVIWHWKMFERIGKPGWWSILMLIPVVNLIIIGIAAWSK